MDELTNWLESLDTQQLRALASQAGITCWNSRDRESLLELCRCNANVVDIYEENYGTETSIPG